MKHLPTSNKESEEINSPLFNDSILSVLKDNCGIGIKKVRHVSKIDQKIIPGQPILQLHVEEIHLLMINHHPQKRIKKENLHPKNSNKKKKKKKIITDDNDWICADCGEVWNDDGDCCWITCDICSNN